MQEEDTLVFIDFEAISRPILNDVCKFKQRELIYCYSLAVKDPKTNKFQVKSSIVPDFKLIKNQKDYYNLFKKLISKDIFSINKNFKINNINFLTFNGDMERKNLKKIFPHATIKDVRVPNKKISLKKITEDLNSGVNYFTNFKNNITKSKILSDYKHFDKLTKDGYVASLAGALYYFYQMYKGKVLEYKRAKIFNHFNISKKTLIKEIMDYSADDVYRMIYIYENPKLIAQKCKLLDLEKTKQENIDLQIANLELLKQHFSWIKQNVDHKINTLEDVDLAIEKLKNLKK